MTNVQKKKLISILSKAKTKVEMFEEDLEAGEFFDRFDEYSITIAMSGLIYEIEKALDLNII
jgi:hypothetical protein